MAPQPAPDSRSPDPPLWDKTLGWFLLLFFLWNVGMGAFSPLLPSVMEGLGLSFAGAGLLGTAFALARFAVDVPAGLLADRLGVRWLFHGAAGMLVAGMGLAALVGSFEGMAAARALTGVGSGLANIVSVLYLMRQGSAAHRTRRANLCELAIIAGMAVSAELAGGAATRWDWRTTFGLASGMLGLVWLVGALVVLPGIRGILRKTGPGPAPAGGPRPRGSRAAVLAVFTASFAQAFAWGGGIATLLPLYGGSVLHLSPAAIGRTMAVALWVEVCLLYPVGCVADARGKLTVMLPGFAAMLLGTLLVPWTTGPLGYGVAFACLTAGMSVWMTVPALLAEQLAGSFGGKAAGLYRLTTDLGFILAPGVVGWLVGRLGFGAGTLAIAAVLCGSLALSVAFLRPPAAPE